MDHFKLKNLTTVVSKILGNKLIKDGIVGQPLVIRTGKTVDFIQAYGIGMNNMICRPIHPGASVKTWAPSFIDEAHWAQMLMHLRPGQRFWGWCLHIVDDENLDLTTAGIITMDDIAESFRERDFVNQPMRIAKGKIYFFDENLVYQCRKEVYEGVRVLPIRHWPLENMTFWQMAATHFIPGMTFEECMRRYLEMERVGPKKKPEGLYTKLEQLVQKVSSPEFERSTDNPKQNTVDRIRVEVSLPKYRLSRQELLAEIKAHKSEIDNLVLEKIVQSKRFQKYGVPINCFRLTNCILRADSQLEYLFELKEIHGAGENPPPKIMRRESNDKKRARPGIPDD